MGVAWKESTSNGPRLTHPNRRAVAPPLVTTFFDGALFGQETAFNVENLFSL